MTFAHVRYVLGAALLAASWLALAACDPTTSSFVSSSREPPPISGGTLLVLRDGHTAVAADPDQDTVWFVDLDARAVFGQVPLRAGDEPGRLVEDAAGRVHVVTRRGGALVSIDPVTFTVLSRRGVCPNPRGVAYDAAADALHVACADGLLVTLPAAGGPPTASVRLDRDLRDVVVQGGVRYVSRFRSAEILAVAADGTVFQRITLPVAQAGGVAGGGSAAAVPEVAYRMVATPGGGLAVLHQRAVDALVNVPTDGYYASDGCAGTGVVQGTVTFVTPGAMPQVSAVIGNMPLIVDVALSADGTQVAVAAPGAQVFGSTTAILPLSQLTGSATGCVVPGPGPDDGEGQAIAVAFDGKGRLVTQTRDPAAIILDGDVITMRTTGPTSEGHRIFHAATRGGIACASCHPEGGDDGRVWSILGPGPRRTQNIRGGVLARAPFHWTGDLADMDALVTQVLVGRMSGPTLTEDQVSELGHWMDAQPALAAPPAADTAAVARGQAIFEDEAVGCASCHSGSQLSTHAITDVGTGGAFKVPSLIAVGYRAPFLHDGCAATLLDRFNGTCGGGDQHGHTSQLTAAQLSDLVAYLESL